MTLVATTGTTGIMVCFQTNGPITGELISARGAGGEGGLITRTLQYVPSA